MSRIFMWLQNTLLTELAPLLAVFYFILNESSKILGLKTTAKMSADESCLSRIRLYPERQIHGSS